MSDEPLKLRVPNEPDTLSIRRRRDKRTDCQHKSIVVDQVYRTVYCEQCETVLDPIEQLVRYANEERTIDWKIAKLNELHQRRLDSVRPGCRHKFADERSDGTRYCRRCEQVIPAKGGAE